jgi:hypothetical protein
MGNGHGAWGMERIVLQRASLTAASLIPIAHCPLPNAQLPITNDQFKI